MPRYNYLFILANAILELRDLTNLALRMIEEILPRMVCMPNETLSLQTSPGVSNLQKTNELPCLRSGVSPGSLRAEA